MNELEQQYRETLMSGPCLVVFEKANGDLREMNCTLNRELIDFESAGDSRPTPGIITSWDLDKQAWRRFKMDKVVKAPVLIPDWTTVWA